MILFDPVNRFVWSLAIIILFIDSALFFNKYFSSNQRQRLLLLGMAFLILGLSFSRLFYFISDYYRTGYYEGHIYRAASGGDPTLFNLFGKIATLSFIIGMLLFNLTMELTTHKSHYIPVIINAFNLIWLSSASDISETIATYFAFAFNGILIIFVLLWYTKTTPKELQISSLFLLTGVSLYMIGSVFDSGAFKELLIFSPTVPAIFIIAGTSISILSITLMPGSYNRIRFLFIVLTIILLLSLIFAIITSIRVLSQNIENFLLVIAIWIAFVMAIILFFYTLSRLKFSLEIINGKRIPPQMITSYDLLTPFLFKDTKGEIKIFRELDNTLLQRIQCLSWEEGEKDEFIQYCLSLSPRDREKILTKMIERSKLQNSLEEGDSP